MRKRRTPPSARCVARAPRPPDDPTTDSRGRAAALHALLQDLSDRGRERGESDRRHRQHEDELTETRAGLGGPLARQHRRRWSARHREHRRTAADQTQLGSRLRPETADRVRVVHHQAQRAAATSRRTRRRRTRQRPDERLVAARERPWRHGAQRTTPRVRVRPPAWAAALGEAADPLRRPGHHRIPYFSSLRYSVRRDRPSSRAAATRLPPAESSARLI